MSMDNIRAKRILATLGLLLAGCIWGASFIVMKNAVADMPVNFILAVRFCVAALGLGFAMLKFRARMSLKVLVCGVIMGALLYASIAVQTYGLIFTTAGKNALITATYIIIVPILVCIRKKTRLQPRIIAAAAVCFIGIALLSLGGGEGGINLGDVLSFASGIIIAVHLIVTEMYVEKYDVLLLTCVQFATAGILAWIACFCVETVPTQFTPGMWGALAYSAIAATLIAFTLENVGVKYASPEISALMMSTEAPFAVVFSAIFLHELMNGRMIIGCLLVIIAILTCQVDFSRLLHKKTPQAPAVAAGEEEHDK